DIVRGRCVSKVRMLMNTHEVSAVHRHEERSNTLSFGDGHWDVGYHFVSPTPRGYLQACGCAQHIKTILYIDVPGAGADQDALCNAPLTGKSDVDENGILDGYVLADV